MMRKLGVCKIMADYLEMGIEVISENDLKFGAQSVPKFDLKDWKKRIWDMMSGSDKIDFKYESALRNNMSVDFNKKI